ncbi:helix-turn-helix transcriptional regulator [Qipengyuania atrilutea]|uniref:HTH luxR-type domain-containing protein n=1 Tax=Qipengyuania atrilutea TaxID=2744473 RepID=A0A850H429_9SPHN|nr:LuxR C-terminal-related transcriptional regulator [Actirhodobacter atriluteus]NVD45287.1 hypothetical protein [Actirhodobacter atriluteus]
MMRLSFERAYEAVTDDGQFLNILDEVAATIDAKGYAAGWAAHGLIESMFAIKNDWSADMITDYHTNHAPSDPWAAAVFSAGNFGTFQNLSQLVPDKKFGASELYNELLRPGGDDTFYAAGLTMPLPDGAAGGVTFYRGRRQGGFDTDAMKALHEIEADLARLVSLKARLHGQSLAGSHWREAVSRLATPAFVLNAEMALVDYNAAAEVILALGRGLTLRRGRLMATFPASHVELESACNAALNGKIGGLSAVRVTCGNIERRFTVLALPNLGGGQRVLLLGDQPEAVGRTQGDLLRLRYRLSPAEATLMCALASGASPQEQALEREVSIETVRTQYRSAVRKMDCKSLTDAIIAVRRILVLAT